MTIEKSPAAGIFLIVVFIVTYLVSIFYGKKLNLALKVASLLLFLYWSINWTLLGRVETVHLNANNLGSAILLFVISSIWILLPLWRLFKTNLRIKVLTLYPLIAILLALVIASAEEQIFIKQFNDGVGPTPRWTVNIAWLAYDASSGELKGGW
ncbi:MAG: hypothetical protein V3U65_14865 [Granulosicoccaceae bacterium]